MPGGSGGMPPTQQPPVATGMMPGEPDPQQFQMRYPVPPKSDVAEELMKPIEGGPEDRKVYAQKLCRWAQSWIDHISPLYPRWEVNESLVIDQPDAPSELPWEGAKWHHIPVSSSKGNAWLSFVCQPPTSTAPYAVATIFGKDATRAKTVEQDIYMFAMRGEFSRYYRRNTWNTGLYGKSIWRVTYGHDDQDFPIIKYEDIGPRQWIMYPNNCEMKSARMIGHLYEVSVREIEDMQASGEMYDEPDIRGSKLLKTRSSAGVVDNNETTGGADGEDDELQVQCAEVFVKEKWGDDKKPRWYIIRFAKDEEELLGIYEYPYSEPWLFDEYVHEEPDRFWPETSRINSLQSLQHATDALFNQGLWGVQMGWDRPTFTPGWALDQKYRKLKPGTMVPMPQGGTIQQSETQINIAGIQLMMENTDKRADRAMRFSDQQLGSASSSGDRTATGDSIQQQNASIASTDDMANISACMSKVFRFCQEIYRVNYPAFFDAYGDDLATQPDQGTYTRGYPAILGRPMHWDLLGKTPDNSPMAQSHAMNALITSLAQLGNPMLLAFLRAVGINLTEFVQSLIRNSNLNDRDILLMSQDDAPGGGIDQLIQQFQQSEAMKGQKGNPQLDQARIEESQAKIEMEKQKLQSAQVDSLLADLTAIYNNPGTAPDIKRQIEPMLGLKASTLHPVVAHAVTSGDLHRSLLTPPPSPNGKRTPSIVK